VKAFKNRRDGQIAAAFVVFYALFRFAVEFTREPDKQLGYIAFGWLTMGQLLSIVIGLIGVGCWIALSFGRRPAPQPQIETEKPSPRRNGQRKK
jgi:phosphatidylglycerol:prolipoprotein diacylglycerol transferase